MPGNLRRKAGGRGSGRTEADYLRSRRRVLRTSQVCVGCGQAIDLSLKPICRFVDTSGFPVERAHEIPLTCGPECRKLRHKRKANPWSGSADHKIPVSRLPPDSPLLTSAKNLQSFHLVCNQSKGDGEVKVAKAGVKTSRDWFV